MNSHRTDRVDVILPITLGAENFIFEAMVENISRDGFKVSDLPLKFQPGDSDLITIISTPEGVFRMNVQAKWVHQTGQTQEVGFKIRSVNGHWSEFLEYLGLRVDTDNRGLIVPEAVNPNPSVYNVLQ